MYYVFRRKNYLYIINPKFFCDLFYEVVVKKTKKQKNQKLGFHVDKIINSGAF